MPVGICKMCFYQKTLVSSHFMPRAIYDYCRSGDLEPVKFSRKVAFCTSYQVQDYIMCKSCEDVLNDGGEKWTVGKLATMDRKSFPLYEILSKATPQFEDGGAKVYQGVNVAGFEIEQFTHFATGILWKASIHSWSKEKKKPKIDLGPYSDRLRKYLRGEAGFPEHVKLWLTIVPPEAAMIGFIEPHERKSFGGFKSYFCYIPGVLFCWSVGRQVTTELRVGCFATNAYHPFFVSNNVHQILENHTKADYLGARKSGKLVKIRAAHNE
ncbi:MAG TPA: hypothetical protein VFB79_15945 [Candidatus Angelobacter sp.]|nr:hypothetical protein [Candidatus Angelobacter sp.]